MYAEWEQGLNWRLFAVATKMKPETFSKSKETLHTADFDPLHLVVF